jgi:hypothetical protein
MHVPAWSEDFQPLKPGNEARMVNQLQHQDSPVTLCSFWNFILSGGRLAN